MSCRMNAARVAVVTGGVILVGVAVGALSKAFGGSWKVSIGLGGILAGTVVGVGALTVGILMGVGPRLAAGGGANMGAVLRGDEGVLGFPAPNQR